MGQHLVVFFSKGRRRIAAIREGLGAIANAISNRLTKKCFDSQSISSFWMSIWFCSWVLICPSVGQERQVFLPLTVSWALNCKGNRLLIIRFTYIFQTDQRNWVSARSFALFSDIGSIVVCFWYEMYLIICSLKFSVYWMGLRHCFDGHNRSKFLASGH